MNLPEEALANLQRLLQLEPRLQALLSTERDAGICLQQLLSAAERHGLALPQAGLAACLEQSPAQVLALEDEWLQGVAAGISSYTARCSGQLRPDPFEGVLPVIGGGAGNSDLDPGAMITLE